MRLIVFRDDEAAARFLIETMDDAWSFFAADPGKGGAMMKQCIDQRVLPMTRSWMNDETGRFTDNDEIVVFEKNLQRNVLRSIVDLFERRFGYLDLITGADKIARPCRLPV